ncbi:MAG TPA: ester cyclase [Candidatus Angelobacter sp.]|nr:ester cyclase [Candidatus Angelobacter sp.]
MRRFALFLGLGVIFVGALLLQAQKRQPPSNRPGVAEGSPEQNKQAARRVFEDLYTGGRFGEANQIFDPSCKVHFGGRTVGLSEAIAESRGWKSASPDSSMRAEQITANGEKVTVAWSAQGTHSHPGLGIKPTGKHFAMRERSEFLFKNGKIVEVWNNEYRPELFRQLGVSKTSAFMFFAGERLVAALGTILPDRIYASLLQ